MRAVAFKFNPAERVVTTLGQEGVIDTAGIDVMGPIYLVRFKADKGTTNHQWWRESQLETAAVPDTEEAPG